MSTMVKELFEEHVELIKRHFSEEIVKQTASFRANFRELKGIVDDLKQSLEFSQAETADLKSGWNRWKRHKDRDIGEYYSYT